MKKTLLSIFLTMTIAFGLGGYAMAAGDMTAQDPVEIKVSLGDNKNALHFIPADFTFETGKLYKLVLHNPSEMKHYFSSEGLSRSVFTRKAQVFGANGNTIAEIKGTIQEIEVYPGGTAEWWFVPVKTGRFDDLKCTIKGHTEGGMVGTITIK
ncbi:MAG: biphenyl 2,3-dioxygenase [Nitrospirota bacterium]